MSDATLSFSRILSFNHAVAKEFAQEKAPNLQVVNTAFNDKDQSFVGSGEHALIITKKGGETGDVLKDIDTYYQVAKTYFQRFVGESEAEQFQKNDLQPIYKLSEEERQQDQNQTGQEQNEQDQNSQENQNQQQNQQRQPPFVAESSGGDGFGFRFKKFHTSICESMIDSIMFEAEQQGQQAQQQPQQQNAQQQVQPGQQNQQQNQNQVQQDQNADNDQNVCGFLVFYDIEVERKKQYKFTDLMKDKFFGIFGNMISDVLNWKIKWRGKEYHVGKFLDPKYLASLMGQQDIDSDKVAGFVRKAFVAQFPNTNVITDCYQAVELTKILKEAGKITPKIKSKIDSANYSVTIRISKEDTAYTDNADDMLNIVVDKCNKAFGTNRQIRNSNGITEKDVIRVNNVDFSKRDRITRDQLNLRNLDNKVRHYDAKAQSLKESQEQPEQTPEEKKKEYDSQTNTASLYFKDGKYADKYAEHMRDFITRNSTFDGLTEKKDYGVMSGSNFIAEVNNELEKHGAEVPESMNAVKNEKNVFYVKINKDMTNEFKSLLEETGMDVDSLKKVVCESLYKRLGIDDVVSEAEETSGDRPLMNNPSSDPEQCRKTQNLIKNDGQISKKIDEIVDEIERQFREVITETVKKTVQDVDQTNSLKIENKDLRSYSSFVRIEEEAPNQEQNEQIPQINESIDFDDLFSDDKKGIILENAILRRNLPENILAMDARVQIEYLSRVQQHMHTNPYAAVNHRDVVTQYLQSHTLWGEGMNSLPENITTEYVGLVMAKRDQNYQPQDMTVTINADNQQQVQESLDDEYEYYDLLTEAGRQKSSGTKTTRVKKAAKQPVSQKTTADQNAGTQPETQEQPKQTEQSPSQQDSPEADSTGANQTPDSQQQQQNAGTDQQAQQPQQQTAQSAPETQNNPQQGGQSSEQSGQTSTPEQQGQAEEQGNPDAPEKSGKKSGKKKSTKGSKKKDSGKKQQTPAEQAVENPEFYGAIGNEYIQADAVGSIAKNVAHVKNSQDVSWWGSHNATNLCFDADGYKAALRQLYHDEEFAASVISQLKQQIKDATPGAVEGATVDPRTDLIPISLGFNKQLRENRGVEPIAPYFDVWVFNTYPNQQETFPEININVSLFIFIVIPDPIPKIIENRDEHEPEEPIKNSLFIVPHKMIKDKGVKNKYEFHKDGTVTTTRDTESGYKREQL